MSIRPANSPKTGVSARSPNLCSRPCIALAGLLSCLFAAVPGWAAPKSPPEGVWVRDGYTLDIVVDRIARPRFMAFGPDGALYVSIPHLGRIEACRDVDGDGEFEDVRTVLSDHQSVRALLWHDGWLWFTTSGSINRMRDADGDGKFEKPETIIGESELPSGGGHWYRPLLILHQRLYTAIGDSSNISVEDNTDRQKIWSYALDGSGKQLFATGIRNTEKFVLRPGTDEIWGMDHGSDVFGRVIEEKGDGEQPITDYNPPDEMNRYVEGGFYGHPYVTGNKLPRYEYMGLPGLSKLAQETIPPQWVTAAHAAPNAMCFYTGDQFPAEHRGDAFVAYHGSWNRSERVGYAVTRVLFEDGKPYGELTYATWLRPDGKRVGRPVDVVVGPDGSLFISDDGGDRIYRLRYSGPSE